MICRDIKIDKLDKLHKCSMDSIRSISNFEIKKGSDEHLDNISHLNKCFNSLFTLINLYNNSLQEGLELDNGFSEKVIRQTLELSNSFTCMLINYKSNPLYKDLLTDVVNSINDELTRMYNIIPQLVNFDNNIYHEFEYFHSEDDISSVSQTAFEKVWENEDDEYWNSYL